MVARLKEIDAVVPHQVDQPMFLRHPPRPASVKVELQRFRLSDAFERIPENGFRELQNSQSGLALRSNPVTQVFSKLGMKDRDAGLVR